MKINETKRVHDVNAYRHQNKLKSTGQTGSVSKRDEVLISPEAKELLQSNASERAEKIEALKDKVQAGAYRVSDADLAARLLPFLID